MKKVALVFLLLIIIVGIIIALYYLGYIENIFTTTTTTKYSGDTSSFSMHFLELGNKYTGDSIYVKAGNNDILIDAGSRTSSASTIEEYVDQYCTDSKLEYVIATHAHQDHIAGFYSNSTTTGIFEYYDVDTIIDFPLTNSETQTYEKYCEARDNSGATHYTALECYNQENGASRVYQLGEGLQMEILYNYYYDHETTNENNYSVCVLFTQGNNNYLLTGDLEGEGESYLVENNDLPVCKVFKAAHHGSYTGSTDTLLEVIKPETVVFTCVAGSDEYTDNPDNMFPSKQALQNISEYTDKCYVTSISDGDSYASLNGSIVISGTTSDTYTVNCSNNNTLLKNTTWYIENRGD